MFPDCDGVVIRFREAMPGGIGKERRSKPQDDLVHIEAGVSVTNDNGEVGVRWGIESSVHISAYIQGI